MFAAASPRKDDADGTGLPVFLPTNAPSTQSDAAALAVLPQSAILMLKILIFGLNYAPELTGTGKYTGEMAAWLASRGHGVDVIAALPHYPAWTVDPAYRGRGYCQESLEGVRVLRAPFILKGSGEISARSRILMETSYSLATLRYWLPIFLRRTRYDVVLGICPPMQMGLFPLLYSKTRRVPWLFHLQDFQVDAAFRLGILRGQRFGSLLARVEGYLLRSASAVTTISEEMRGRAIGKGTQADATWLLPNWADIEGIRPGPHENEFRRAFGIPVDHLLLLCAGNIGKKQGVDIILHAADHLRSDPRLHFLVVGEGADEARVKAVAAELDLPNLRFAPLQPPERLSEMLTGADIHLLVQRSQAADLVLPSRMASILAAGRPSIATAAPGTALHRIMVEEDVGYATPPDEISPLVRAIMALASDPMGRARMGRNARAYAERHLSKEMVLTDFENRMLSLVASRG